MMQSSVLSSSAGSGSGSGSSSASISDADQSQAQVASNQQSQSQSQSCHLEGCDESFEVTDRSMADTVAMGDHELPLLVHKSSTHAQFGKSAGGPAVSIVVDEQDSPARREGGVNDGEQRRQQGLPAGHGDGYDVCREYGYKYEYTEEEDEDDDGSGGNAGDSQQQRQQHTRPKYIDHDEDPLYVSTAHAIGGQPYNADGGGGSKAPRSIPDWSSAAAIATDSHTNTNSNADSDSASQFGGTSHLLGHSYHPVHDFSTRRDDESSLLWMTYRRDFPIINPYGITSDAGWGCMLRSAQMMLCQALRVHYVGREWRPPKSFVRRRQDAFVADVLTWFADYPSSDGGSVCKYSLHSMVAAGFKYEMLPGEWYGPQTACHVIKDLCEMHSSLVDTDGNIIDENEEEETKEERDTTEEGAGTGNTTATTAAGAQNDVPMFRVHVAQEGSVYRDAIDELMTRDAGKDCDGNSSKAEDKASPEGSSTLSSDSYVIEDPLLNNPLSAAATDANCKSKPDLEWDTALLLLIPLRLGLKSFNADTYRLPLAHTFALRQSVGFLGGTPRHALWFYGASSDGTKIYGLDPHTVQDTPRRRRAAAANGKEAGSNRDAFEIILSDEYLRSMHCTNPSTMEMSRIDPSLALAFYCRNRSDFDDLCAALDDMKAEGKKYKIPELFCVADAAPDYCANVSSALVDMMMSSSIGHLGGGGGFDGDFADDGGASDSDDEEYVML